MVIICCDVGRERPIKSAGTTDLNAHVISAMKSIVERNSTLRQMKGKNDIHTAWTCQMTLHGSKYTLAQILPLLYLHIKTSWIFKSGLYMTVSKFAGVQHSKCAFQCRFILPEQIYWFIFNSIYVREIYEAFGFILCLQLGGHWESITNTISTLEMCPPGFEPMSS